MTEICSLERVKPYPSCKLQLLEIIIAGENPKGNKEICYCRKEKEMMDGE